MRQCSRHIAVRKTAPGMRLTDLGPKRAYDDGARRWPVDREESKEPLRAHGQGDVRVTVVEREVTEQPELKPAARDRGSTFRNLPQVSGHAAPPRSRAGFLCRQCARLSFGSHRGNPLIRRRVRC